MSGRGMGGGAVGLATGEGAGVVVVVVAAESSAAVPGVASFVCAHAPVNEPTINPVVAIVGIISFFDMKYIFLPAFIKNITDTFKAPGPPPAELNAVHAKGRAEVLCSGASLRSKLYRRG